MIKKTDIFFTDDGDFHIDTDHDIGLTDNYYRAITQEIKLRLDNSFREVLGLAWGASLTDFSGKPAGEAVLADIKKRVTDELLRYNLLGPQEFRVETTFISRTQVLIMIGLFDNAGMLMLKHRFTLGDKK